MNAAQIAELKVQFRSLDDREKRLESAIAADAARALEVPLMRRDLDALSKEVVANQAVAKADIERVYTLSQWLLGGLAVAMITLAVTTAVGLLVKPKLA